MYRRARAMGPVHGRLWIAWFGFAPLTRRALRAVSHPSTARYELAVARAFVRGCLIAAGHAVPAREADEDGSRPGSERRGLDGGPS
jgi:hypothetical protein